MKKLIAIFLLLVYSFIAYGVTVSRHYCSGKQVKASVVPFESVNCCCQDAPKECDCCKDELTQVDSEDHNLRTVAFEEQQAPLLMVTCFIERSLELTSRQNTSSRFFINNEGLYHPPLYLMNRVFRI